MIKNKLLNAALVAAITLVAACGGGGDSSPTTTTPSVQASVAGPLDSVQSTLSSTILGPLESATANTALAGVLKCVNGAVNGNILDIGDTVLNALGQPTSAVPSIAAGLQVQINQLAQNLAGLIASLASQGNCTQPATTSGNPLAGTGLAVIGEQLLPVIQHVLSQTAVGNSNGFASLASLVSQLDAALQTAIAQLPASATSAPIVGGTLTTLNDSLSDTASLLTALANNDGTALKTALQNLLDHLLVNVLTGIVPVSLIESQAGKPGAISTPIQQAAATFSAAVASALSAGTSQLLAALNSTQLAPVINPVVNGVLPALITPLTNLLDGLGNISGTTAGGPTGSGLDALLVPVIHLLGTVLGSTSNGTCIFASLPLVSALCPST